MPCSPGMTACHRRCLHRLKVLDYRIERERQVVDREAETGGYATEVAGFGDIITFKQYLIDTAGEPPP